MLFVRSAHSLKDHHHNNACDRTAGSDDEGREHEVDIVYGNVLIIACNQGGDYRGPKRSAVSEGKVLKSPPYENPMHAIRT